MNYAFFDEDLQTIMVVNKEPDSGIFYPVPDDTDPNALYFKEGQARIKPPRPNAWSAFDTITETWVDTRTADDWAAELYRRRAAASMSRIDFVLVCTRFGILTQKEALVAVQGGVPPTMQAIIDGLPSEEKFEAEIRWMGATVIVRTNSLIINMSAAIFIDEWTLDQVFGIAWPDPLASWPEGQVHF